MQEAAGGSAGREKSPETAGGQGAYETAAGGSKRRENSQETGVKRALKEWRLGGEWCRVVTYFGRLRDEMEKIRLFF